jgi:hypothetical protein
MVSEGMVLQNYWEDFMRRVAVIIAFFLTYPSLCIAVVDVPQYDCKVIDRGGENIPVVSCIVKQIMKESVNPELDLAKLRSELSSNAIKAYTAKEMDEALGQRDKVFADMKHALEDKMNHLEVLIPQQIGDRVQQTIKENLRAVLSNIIKTDPDFRDAIAELIKSK